SVGGSSFFVSSCGCSFFVGLPPRPPAYRAVVLAAVVAGRRARRARGGCGGRRWSPGAGVRGTMHDLAGQRLELVARQAERAQARGSLQTLRELAIARPASECSSVPAMAAAICGIAGGEHDTGRKGGVDEGIEGLHGSPTRRARASGRDRRCVHQVILAECAAAQAARTWIRPSGSLPSSWNRPSLRIAGSSVTE